MNLSIQKIMVRLDQIGQKEPTNSISPKLWNPVAEEPSGRREWVIRTLASLGVPAKYRQFRLSDFKIRTIPDSQDGGLDWSRGGFLLRGCYGQGKSCFAGAVVRAFLCLESPVKVLYRDCLGKVRVRENAIQWWHSSDLADYILDETFAGRRREMNRELMTPKVIVLDDFGKERMANVNVRKAMAGAIERWTSNDKFLIVTTNLPDDQALAQYEGSIASRFNELVEVVLPPVDLRGLSSAVNHRGMEGIK